MCSGISFGGRRGVFEVFFELFILLSDYYMPNIVVCNF